MKNKMNTDKKHGRDFFSFDGLEGDNNYYEAILNDATDNKDLEDYETINDIFNTPYRNFQNFKLHDHYYHKLEELKKYVEYLIESGCTYFAIDNDRIRSYIPANLTKEEKLKYANDLIQKHKWFLDDYESVIEAKKEELLELEKLTKELEESIDDQESSVK